MRNAFTHPVWPVILIAPGHQLCQFQIERGELAADYLFERSELVLEPFHPPGQAVFNAVYAACQIVDPLSQLVRADPHPAESDNYRAGRADQCRDYLVRHFFAAVFVALAQGFSAGFLGEALRS